MAHQQLCIQTYCHIISGPPEILYPHQFTDLLANAEMVTELRCLISQEVLQHPLIRLRSQQRLTVVVPGKDVMDDGHYAPEGIRFFEEEQSNGRQSVEALAVANVLVVPTEGNQHSTKLIDLAKYMYNVI